MHSCDLGNLSSGSFLSSVEVYFFQIPCLLWVFCWIYTLDLSLFLKSLTSKGVSQGSVSQQHGNPIYCHFYSCVCSENKVRQNAIGNSINTVPNWNFLCISSSLSISHFPLAPTHNVLPRHTWAAHHRNCDVFNPLYLWGRHLIRINWHKLALFAGYSFVASLLNIYYIPMWWQCVRKGVLEK